MGQRDETPRLRSLLPLFPVVPHQPLIFSHGGDLALNLQRIVQLLTFAWPEKELVAAAHT
jgi:hypothetical protein